jgi:hypothetical protein
VRRPSTHAATHNKSGTLEHSYMIVRSPALLVQHIENRGMYLFQEICACNMEGIVAKLANAPYTPEATIWAKIKNPGCIRRRKTERSSSMHEHGNANQARLRYHR